MPIISANKFETIGVTHSVTRQVSVLVVNKFETLGVTEGRTGILSVSKLTKFETITVAHVITRRANPGLVSVFDAKTVSESTTRRASAGLVAVSDSVRIYEATDPVDRRLSKRQATGEVLAGGQSYTLSFPVPPEVGNGIIVLTTLFDFSTGTFPVNACSDNYGNLYQRAVLRKNGAVAAIFYCEWVEQAGDPFVITVRGTTSADYVGAAIEVRDIGTGLILRQTASASNSGTAITTGATPIIEDLTVFAAAIGSVFSNNSAITVAPVTPPWEEEFEELTAAYVPGEGDTRQVTMAAGTAIRADWTATNSGNCVGVLAAFGVSQPGALGVRVSEPITVTALMIDPRLMRAVVEAVTTRDGTPADGGLIGVVRPYPMERYIGFDDPPGSNPPIRVRDRVATRMDSRVIEVRVAEEISTSELSPKEPPSHAADQVIPLVGYQFPHYLAPIAGIGPQADALDYFGPFFSGSTSFTLCFWTFNHGAYRQTLGSFDPNWFLGYETFAYLLDTPPYFRLNVVANSNGSIVGTGSPRGFGWGWHHIAITYTASSAATRLFIDGYPAGSTFGGLTAPYWVREVLEALSLSDLNVPWPPGAPGQWVMRAAYYRSWSAVLSLAELLVEMQARTAVRSANLWRDTPLENGSVLDLTAGGRHWEIRAGAIPAYGQLGPLWYLAEGTTIKEIVHAVAKRPGDPFFLDYVGVTDWMRATSRLSVVLTETVTVRDLSPGGAPLDPHVRCKQVRWYTPPTAVAPSFTPSALRGPWSAVSPGALFWDGVSDTYVQVPATSVLSQRTPLPSLPFNNPYEVGADGTDELWGLYYWDPGTIPAVEAGQSCCCGRSISEPLPAQVVTGMIQVNQLVDGLRATYISDYWDYEEDGDPVAPPSFRLYLYVTVGDTDAVRGVLFDYADPRTRVWPVSYGGGYSEVANFAQIEPGHYLHPVVLQAGDRIVIEWGFQCNDGAVLPDDVLPWANYRIGYYPTSSQRLPDAPVTWPPGEWSTYKFNGWVDFLDGIYVTMLEAPVVGDPVTVQTMARSVLLYANKIRDFITVRDEVFADAGDVYVRLAETVHVLDIASKRDQPIERIRVVDAVTARRLPGAGRWYLTATPATYAPPTFRGDWDATELIPYYGGDPVPTPVFALSPTKIGGGVEERTEGAELEVVEVDYLLARWVSPPLAAQTITGQIQMAFQPWEANTGTFYTHLHIWVTQGESDALRGTLITDYVDPSGANVWPGFASYQGRKLASARTVTPVTLLAGDRIVIELGFKARNTTQTTTGTVLAGTLTWDGIELPDLIAPGDYYASTFAAGWIDFTTQLLLLTTVSRSLADTITVTAHAAIDQTLRITVFDTIHVTTVATRVFDNVGANALKVFVHDDIRVIDTRQRETGGPRLFVTVRDYVYTREHVARLFLPFVWDGSGTPPGPATMAGDYWVTGV